MLLNLDLQIMPHQHDFVFDLTTPIIGFSGGMRMGKSVAACHHAIVLSAVHLGKKGAILSPTLGMTQRNIVPILRDLVEKYGLDVTGLDAKEPRQLFIRWGHHVSEIVLSVSAEEHGRLNGMTLAWAILDEADKCSPKDVDAAVQQMIMRCSNPTAPYPGQVCITSTPEGQAFMYDYFVRAENEHKKLYRAKMRDNYLLPQSYIDLILSQIPKHLQPAYMDGEFVSLTDGGVYKEYDIYQSKSSLTIADLEPTDNLWASFDLNYGGMSCVVAIIRGKEVHIVKEYMGLLDTDVLLKKLLVDLPNDRLIITCDPACTQALPLIKASKLKARIMSSHPSIEWRIKAVNNKFCNAKDERTLFINPKTAPVLNKCVLMQQYINGEPDKKTKIPEAKTDVSGPVDALGYLIYLLYPYNPTANQPVKLRGF